MRNKPFRYIFQSLVVVGCAALSGQAMAHTGVDAHHGASFLAGLVHPLMGVDHLAAMLAVGLWSALVAPRDGLHKFWGPLAFSNVLLVGALLAMNGVTLGAATAIEPMVAVSVLVMGLLVATRSPLGIALTAAVAGGFALFHGLAHGQELANQPQAFECLAGMLCSTVALHAIGLALGSALRQHPLWLSRAVGVAVAALGGALMLQLT